MPSLAHLEQFPGDAYSFTRKNMWQGGSMKTRLVFSPRSGHDGCGRWCRDPTGSNCGRFNLWVGFHTYLG